MENNKESFFDRMRSARYALADSQSLNAEEIDEFRDVTLNFLIPIIAITGFVWGMLRGYMPMFQLFWPPFAIALLATAAAFSRKLGPRHVSLGLALGLCWIFIAVSRLWLRPDLVYFNLPVVAFAGVMLGFYGSLAFVLQFTLIMTLMVLSDSGGEWVAVISNGPILGGWLIWLVVRAGMHSYIDMLAAARRDRQWALNRYESGKNFQAELRLALRQIENANYRICRQNQALEEARFEAEQARKAKNEFAATVSHELLTPINLIAGYSEMICKSPEAYGDRPLPTAYRADVWAIYHSALHLRSLISDVLDLSRLDTGKLPLYKEVIDSGELLNQVVEIAHDLVIQKGLKLIVNRPAQPGYLMVDVKRIRQVWLNLIKNAVRFTERGTICLAIERSPDTGELIHCVQDSGTGIAAEDIPRLFRPFEQISSQLQSEHEGAGLGLALCKSFVEEHEGRIWVESQVGQGSSFFFALKEFLPPSKTNTD